MGVFCEELVSCKTTCAEETDYPEDCKGVGKVEDYSCGTGTRETVAVANYDFRCGRFFLDRGSREFCSWGWIKLMLYFYFRIE